MRRRARAVRRGAAHVLWGFGYRIRPLKHPLFWRGPTGQHEKLRVRSRAFDYPGTRKAATSAPGRLASALQTQRPLQPPHKRGRLQFVCLREQNDGRERRAPCPVFKHAEVAAVEARPSRQFPLRDSVLCPQLSGERAHRVVDSLIRAGLHAVNVAARYNPHRDTRYHS